MTELEKETLIINTIFTKEDIKEAVAAEIRKVSDEAEEENEKSERSAAASSNTGRSSSGGADVKIPEKCLKGFQPRLTA